MLELVGNAVPVVRVFERLFGATDTLEAWGKLGIEGDEFHLVLWHVFFGKNRIGRAFGNTDGTVDAFVRVDDQKVGSFAKTIYRTHVHTVCELTFNTVFGHNMRHVFHQSANKMVIFYLKQCRMFGIPLGCEMAVLMFKKIPKNSP